MSKFDSYKFINEEIPKHIIDDYRYHHGEDGIGMLYDLDKEDILEYLSIDENFEEI